METIIDKSRKKGFLGFTDGNTTHYEVHTVKATISELGHLLLMLEKIKEKIMEDFDDTDSLYEVDG